MKDAPAVMEHSGSWRPSEALVSRIKRCYRIAINKEPPQHDLTIWSMIASKQKDIHDALLSDDRSAIELLSEPSKTNLYYGVDNLCKDIVPKHPPASDGAGQELRQMIETLAEAIGRKLVCNPLGGERFPDKSAPPSLSTEQYLQEISAALGVQLRFPNPFAGEYGIRTTQGMISYRAVPAIYQAYRMLQACLSLGGGDCLEIGAGMGRTVYYARQLGLRCTIIDLPMTIVGQALFLSAALGEDAVWMLGDPMPMGNRIALLPPSEIATPDRSFDVVLNADSLTEMGRNAALTYMKFIEARARFFISINHEANHFTVHELSALTPNLVPLSRCLYWLRDGYVEEMFAVRKEIQTNSCSSGLAKSDRQCNGADEEQDTARGVR